MTAPTTSAMPRNSAAVSGSVRRFVRGSDLRPPQKQIAESAKIVLAAGRRFCESLPVMKNNDQFEITVHTNTDIEPAERFASVRHIESDCGCDFYESGEELEWQDNNGLLSNCEEDAICAARKAAKEALA